MKQTLRNAAAVSRYSPFAACERRLRLSAAGASNPRRNWIKAIGALDAATFDATLIVVKLHIFSNEGANFSKSHRL